PAATVVAARLHGASLEYLALGAALLVLQPPTGEPLLVGDNQPFPQGEELRLAAHRAEPGSPERAAL
ncbi:integrase, partial [Streptomyces tateyamensis]